MVCFDFSVVYGRTVLYLYTPFKYVYPGIKSTWIVSTCNQYKCYINGNAFRTNIACKYIVSFIFKAISLLGHCAYNVIPAKIIFKNKCISDCKYYTCLLYTYVYGLMRIKIYTCVYIYGSLRLHV